MRSRIVSAFSNALVAAKVGALDAAGRYKELGDALLPAINPILTATYGLEMATFVIENVSAPPEVEKAIDTRASMQAVGNLNDYVRYQVAQAFGRDGAGHVGSPAGAFGAEMAAGLVMAQQVLKQTGAIGTAADASSAAPSGIPETLSPADAAQALGVSEADVVASLESGDLKGKRIGSQWRVTRAAIAQFLQ